MPKFQVTMKDPDTLHDACDRAAREQVAAMEGLDEEERESLAETRATKFREVAERWFKWSEYLTVEIDTDAKTCVVVTEK